MTGNRITWAVVAAVLGEVLLTIGQMSPDLPVFALQAASSAALSALVTCAVRRLWDTAAPGHAEAAPGTGGGSP